MFYANDFGNKDSEHRIYKTYLESKSQRKSAEEALKFFKVRIFYFNHGECV